VPTALTEPPPRRRVQSTYLSIIFRDGDEVEIGSRAALERAPAGAYPPVHITPATRDAAGAFPMATRKTLFDELQPWVTTFDGHPWNWAAQFVRWRPDRESASCTYDQLDRPVRFNLADVLIGGEGPA